MLPALLPSQQLTRQSDEGVSGSAGSVKNHPNASLIRFRILREKSVAWTACRAPFDGRTPIGVVLGHVRSDVHLAQRCDEGGCFIILINAQCISMAPLHAAPHGQCGFAFGLHDSLKKRFSRRQK
jgi:hypothetical protein